MIQIIGWTLIHSLWQILLIGVLYWLLKNGWRQSSSWRNYLLAVGALGATFLVPIFTFCYLLQTQFTFPSGDNFISEITNATSPTLITTREIVVETSLTFSQQIAIYFPYLVAFWGLGVVCCSIRLYRNIKGIKRLQNSNKQLLGSEWLATINQFKEKLNIQKEVQVYLSTAVKEPITFGHFTPIILLPISLMTGFNATAIETIILHELAHIKRNDYLVNLGQCLIEILLFYHPIVWWLSKEIRTLREHCCDDLVLAHSNNRDVYVTTLTTLQWQKQGVVANRISMSATGQDFSFTYRIKRMFGVQEEGFSFRHLMTLFLLLLISACGTLTFKEYEWRKLFYTNETGVEYPDKKMSYVIDERTKIADIRKMEKEIAELGISISDLSMCSSFNHRQPQIDTIKSISLSYFRQKGEVIPLSISNLRKTPVQLIFDNGYLQKPTILGPIERNKTGAIPAPNNSIPTANLNSLLVNTTTTRQELFVFASHVGKLGVCLDYGQSIFDDAGKVVELHAQYNGEGCSGNFSAMNLTSWNVNLVLTEERKFVADFIFVNKKATKPNDTSNPSIGSLQRPVDTIPFYISNPFYKKS